MKMKMNVFSWNHYKKSFYITHFWLWFRELGQNIRAAFQRIRRGYADRDIFNLDQWLLTILPAMLRQYAEDPYVGCPIDLTREQWTMYVKTLANRLEGLQDDWSTSKNEYDDEYSKLLEQRLVVKQDNNFCTVTCEQDEVLQDLNKKWNERCKELAQLQQEETEKVFLELAKNLYQLWT